MKTVYYAHPMSSYGTQTEIGDMSTLQARFDTVINPNTPELQQAARQQKKAGRPAMQPFLDAVRNVDAVAYRPFPNGKIGAGIANEIIEGLVHGKVILQLPDLTPGKFDMNDVLSIEETREAIKVFSISEKEPA